MGRRRTREYPRTALSECVRDVRKRLGLTQTELARRIGEFPEFVGMVEAGRRRPGLDKLVKWADALHYPRADFIRIALSSISPSLYTALFTQPPPEPDLELAETLPSPELPIEVQRFVERFMALPEEKRRLVQNLVDFLGEPPHLPR